MKQSRLLVYRPPVHPATVAAKADYIIAVGDLVEGLGLRDAVRSLGVEAEVYPLDTYRAPTLFSLLGLVGLLLEKIEKRETVAIVDLGPGSLVLQAYRVIVDAYKPRVEELTSPLHYRLLSALAALRDTGLDLAKEAARHRHHAFTGGDARRSDRILLAYDIERQLGLSGLTYRVYMKGSLEGAAHELLQALDPRGEGAVETLAIDAMPDEQYADAVLGCRLLLHPLGCRPEEEAAREPLRRLLRETLNRRLGGVYSLEPEEAACIAYSEYPC